MTTPRKVRTPRKARPAPPNPKGWSWLNLALIGVRDEPGLSPEYRKLLGCLAAWVVLADRPTVNTLTGQLGDGLRRLAGRPRPQDSHHQTGRA